MAYCTRADVKLALDPNMGAADDGFVDILVLQAQADLDSEIGFSFQQDVSATTRYYDGTGALDLLIDNLVSLSSATERSVLVTQQGTTWITGSTTEVDITADILLKPNNYTALGVPAYKMVRRSRLPFTEGVQNIKVTGIFGWPIIAGQVYPGVPNDIMRACIRLAIHYFKMRDTAYSDVVQAQGGIRERYFKDWPDDVKRTVANYRRTLFRST